MAAIFTSIVFLLLPYFSLAVPVSQSATSFTGPYDAVVVGTNDIIELMPESTGVPIPITALTSADIESCGPQAVCVGTKISDNAGHVSTSVLQSFNTAPSSVQAAVQVIVEAIEQGISEGAAGQTATSISTTLGPSSLDAAFSLIVSAIEGGAPSINAGSKVTTTSVGSTTNPGLSSSSASGTIVAGPTTNAAVLTYATQVTNIQGSVTDEVVAVGSQSGKAYTSVLSKYPDTTTRAGSTTNPGLNSSPTSQTKAAGPTTNAAVRTFATQVTNAQGSITEAVVAVGSQSGKAYSSVLSDYPDSIITTVQALPSGASIQTITTSTCTTAGALVTTTTSGSTVSTVVPELCANGLAFLIFGLPDLSSGSSSTSLCHRAFSFPVGILWRLLCAPIGPPQISIISVDPSELPPPDGPPGSNPPTNSPPGNPEPTNPQSQTQSQEKGTTTHPTSTTFSSFSSSSSTSTSSSAPTMTRYALMPLLSTPASEFEALYARFAQQKNVTQVLNADGSLDFFALELNDTYAATLDANNDFIIIPESSIEIEEEDSGVTDPDLDGANATAESGPGQNVGARDLNDDQESRNPRLLKRIPLAGWVERFTWWSMAIISLVPGLPLPQYRHSSDTDYVYPYYYANAVPPGQGVRVYLLDTGLNMQHPEFNNRLRPGIRQGQTQTDWNIDWLFPQVDTREGWYETDSRGLPAHNYYTYSYIDPNAPNPSGGIHPAYSDFRWRPVSQGGLTPHGTRLSAFIIGNQLGLATACSFTVVKLPQYTSGPLGSNANFPLFSVRSALGLIKQDILSRRAQGETSFVISSSLGYPFGYDKDEHPVNVERSFTRMWQSYLDWFTDNGVAIVASAGNSRQFVVGAIILYDLLLRC